MGINLDFALCVSPTKIILKFIGCVISSDAYKMKNTRYMDYIPLCLYLILRNNLTSVESNHSWRRDSMMSLRFFILPPEC